MIVAMRLCILKPMKTQQKGNIDRQARAATIWNDRRPEIESMYVHGTQSQAEMAARYGVTLAGFQKALKRLSLPSKSRGRPGAANGRYKDGTQSTAYRAMVDKTRCNRCGATADLVIHHMDGVHTNNTPTNLEILCSPCHSSHHKRAWWMERKSLAS